MPTSALGILVFIIAVAPGLFFEIVLQLKITRPKESAFLEIGRVLLASALIFGPAALLTATIWSAFGAVPLDFTLLLRQDAQYIGSHVRPLAICLALYEALSFTIAYAYYTVWSRLANSRNKVAIALLGDPSVRRSAWTLVFDNPDQEEAVPVLRVRTHSGVEWVGQLWSYTPNHEVAHRELVLASPISYQTPGMTDFIRFDDAAAVIKGAEIESVVVQYAR